MRFCGCFWRIYDVEGAEDGPQEHALPRQGRGAALLAVDHAQGGADLRPRLETVLVEVMARVLSRAQDEVTLEIGVLAQSEPELLVGQGPVLRSSSRAIGISRSAPGEPLVRESMDPSSKYRSARSR